MNITGKIMIFKNNFGFYEGTIKDGFLSMYKTKTGLAKPKIVIMEYEKISKEEYVPNDEEQNPFEITSDDMLPF